MPSPRGSLSMPQETAADRRARYGRTHPIAPNRNPDASDNPDARAENRRIEIFLKR